MLTLIFELTLILTSLCDQAIDKKATLAYWPDKEPFPTHAFSLGGLSLLFLSKSRFLQIRLFLQ